MFSICLGKQQASSTLKRTWMSSEGHWIYLVRFVEKELSGLGWAQQKLSGFLKKCQGILRGSNHVPPSQQLDKNVPPSLMYRNVTFRSVTCTRKYRRVRKSKWKTR